MKKIVIILYFFTMSVYCQNLDQQKSFIASVSKYYPELKTDCTIQNNYLDFTLLDSSIKYATLPSRAHKYSITLMPNNTKINYSFSYDLSEVKGSYYLLNNIYYKTDYTFIGKKQFAEYFENGKLTKQEIIN